MSAVAFPFRLRHTLTLLSVVFGLCCALGAQTPQPVSRPARMIHSAIDDSVRLTLQDGVHPQTRQDMDLGSIGGDVKLDKMVLLL